MAGYLTELFEKPLFIVWLRGKQQVAPDRWVSKYTKVVDEKLVVTNSRVKFNVLKLLFTPPVDIMSPSGGVFTIEGDDLPKSRVACLASLCSQAPEAPLIPLVPYSDDEESLVEEGEGEDEEEEDVNEAMVEPESMAPVDHEDLQNEADDDSDAQSLCMDDERWETGQVHESNPSKQKKFHISAEYMVLHKEGLIGKLPNITNAGLGRHEEGAWSAHYPAHNEDGKKLYTYRRCDYIYNVS